jgi:hypothetical protein
MPASYQLNLEHRMVMSTASGIVTDTDLIQHQQRLRKDPQFEPSFGQRMDFTGASGISVSVATIQRLAIHRVYAAGSRRAIVLHQGIAGALANMFKDLSEMEGEQVEVFEDLPAARAWLGLGE